MLRAMMMAILKAMGRMSLMNDAGCDAGSGSRTETLSNLE